MQECKKFAKDNVQLTADGRFVDIISSGCWEKVIPICLKRSSRKLEKVTPR